MKVWLKCAHPQAIQNIDEFVSSSDLEECSISSLAQQWMHYSEWVPSEWTTDKNITIITLFQLLSSPDVNWWTGVDYCYVFISCLDSHSDGTHSLQCIHCWASDEMLHFSKSDEETNSSTSCMAWLWTHFQDIFMFVWFNPVIILKETHNMLSPVLCFSQETSAV